MRVANKVLFHPDLCCNLYKFVVVLKEPLLQSTNYKTLIESASDKVKSINNINNDLSRQVKKQAN